MIIENQVCSLEQAKALKELGIVENSVFCFNEYEQHSEVEPFEYNENPETIVGRYMGKEPFTEFKHFGKFIQTIPAFSVSELGVMLPYGQCLSGFVVHGQQGCGYYPPTNESKCAHSVYENTEAQARAAMLIHLLENNLVTASDCNDRLRQ